MVRLGHHHRPTRAQRVREATERFVALIGSCCRRTGSACGGSSSRPARRAAQRAAGGCAGAGRCGGGWFPGRGGMLRCGACSGLLRELLLPVGLAKLVGGLVGAGRSASVARGDFRRVGMAGCFAGGVEGLSSGLGVMIPRWMEGFRLGRVRCRAPAGATQRTPCGRSSPYIRGMRPGSLCSRNGFHLLLHTRWPRGLWPKRKVPLRCSPGPA